MLWSAIRSGALCLILVGCGPAVPEPETQGGTCGPDDACGDGLRCNAEKRCEKDPCGDVDCQAHQVCREGACVAAEGSCDSNGDCSGPGAYCDLTDHTCKEEADPCAGEGCSGHGACVVSGGAPACVCDPGYSAEGLTCLAVVPCSGVSCEAWELCSDGACVADRAHDRCNHNGDCSGPEAYCDLADHTCKVTVDPCAGEACSGHGACVVVDAAPVCLCDPGYRADGLSCLVVDPCAGVSCAAWELCSDGACVADRGQDRCNHNGDCTGEGIYCDVATHRCADAGDTDLCQGVACDGHGVCIENNGRALCVCDQGYATSASGAGCDDLCQDVQCAAWERCAEGACVTDLAAGYCDRDPQCATGQVCDAATHTCRDVCAGVTCQAWEACAAGRCATDLARGFCDRDGDCPTSHHACDLVSHTCRDLCAGVTCVDAIESCVMGRCVLRPGMCLDNADCGLRELCLDFMCVDQCAGIDCGLGACTRWGCACEEGARPNPAGECVDPCQADTCAAKPHSHCEAVDYSRTACVCDAPYQELNGACGQCADALDPITAAADNGSRAGAAVLDLSAQGRWRDLNTLAAADCDLGEDWYRVHALAGQWLRVALWFSHAQGNLNLKLYADVELAAARSQDDDELLLLQVAADGDYFIRVYGARNTYAMDVELLDGCAPDGGCAAGTCQAGRCEPDRCAGVSCGANAACDPQRGACLCAPGTFADPDSGDCLDPCAGDPCASVGGSACVPLTHDAHRCDCPEGRWLDPDAGACVDPCAGEPCPAASTCIAVGFDETTCRCDPGYVWDQGACVDPCEDVCGPHRVCLLQDSGEVSCGGCLGGYLEDPQTGVCTDPCAGYAGCGAYGQCTFGRAGDHLQRWCECDWSMGFWPTADAQGCFAPCAELTCGEDGSCEIGLDWDSETYFGYCSCDSAAGAYPTPDQRGCFDPCAAADCGAHGSCAVEWSWDEDRYVGRCACDADAGYYPTDDRRGCFSLCDGNDCAGHGTCRSDRWTAWCECRDGWQSSPIDPATCIDPSNPCLGHEDCGGHGVCHMEGLPWCECEPPYQAVGLSCKPPPASCWAPIALPPDVIYDERGLTRSASLSAGSCGGADPEAVLELTLTQTRRLRFQVWLQSGAAVAYVREASCQRGRELVCETDGRSFAAVDTVLPAGTYYLFADALFSWDTWVNLAVQTSDPCGGVDCGAHGTCDPMDPDQLCRCDAGYQDVDNVGTCYPACPAIFAEQCGGHGQCFYVDSAPRCGCFAGYQDNDRDLICARACQPGDCPEHGRCTDRSGARRCDCEPPWVADNASLTCVDPCQGVDCGVHSSCRVTPELSASCVCDPDHFSPAGDGTACVTPCAGADCGPHGTCVASSPTDWTCACARGSFQPAGDPHACVAPCDAPTAGCDGHGSCVAQDAATFACDCDPGYFSPAGDLTRCLSPCDQAGADCSGAGWCRAFGAGADDYLCDCFPGFQNKGADKQICNPACDYTLPCGGYGWCDDSSGVVVCTCLEGFQDNDGNGVCGLTCAAALAAGLDCTPTAENHYAAEGCVDSGDVPTCACEEGYQDNDADGLCQPDCAAALASGLDCATDAEARHYTGDCTDADGTAVCACAEGYQDHDTDMACALACQPGMCGEHGCLDDVGAARCDCPEGWIELEGFVCAVQGDSCAADPTVITLEPDVHEYWRSGSLRDMHNDFVLPWPGTDGPDMVFIIEATEATEVRVMVLPAGPIGEGSYYLIQGADCSGYLVAMPASIWEQRTFRLEPGSYTLVVDSMQSWGDERAMLDFELRLETPSCAYLGGCDHGACSFSWDGAWCSCDEGWQGTRCDQPSCDHLQWCNDRGACAYTTERGIYCDCQSGWSGETCSELSCAHLNDCGGHGECATDGWRVWCECDTAGGWGGETCEAHFCDGGIWIEALGGCRPVMCDPLSPRSGETQAGAPVLYKQALLIPGVTDQSPGPDGANFGVAAQLGAYDRMLRSEWVWQEASFSTGFSSPFQDQLIFNLSLEKPGDYQVAFRVSGDAGLSWYTCEGGTLLVMP